MQDQHHSHETGMTDNLERLQKALDELSQFVHTLTKEDSKTKLPGFVW